MMVILICAIAVSALCGFMLYAMCAAAAEADRREAEFFAESQKKREEGDT
ncbi:MAG: hypothetical protein IKO00_10360 [Oscillospiraceae bacterium]|nr:hypothetical protein [Oscillospiraceae bacterium]MBR6862575.1 hypothetical protein [Acidaminococcaceae bacterium]